MNAAPSRLSPLARKLCLASGYSPAGLRGSGPHGRIMAADVRDRAEHSATVEGKGASLLADPAAHPTREPKDGYFVYDAQVDMSALSDISLPIAVQCEKLLENRYSLFDYIVRAMVKACLSAKEWSPKRVDILLFERQGEQTTVLPDAAELSIYRIARVCAKQLPVPPDYHPNIVICDAHTTRDQVADKLSGERRPVFALVLRGNTPKTVIRAGSASTRNLLLPYTFYAAAEGGVSEEAANHIAAELYALLFNPVRLLLLHSAPGP